MELEPYIDSLGCLSVVLKQGFSCMWRNDASLEPSTFDVGYVTWYEGSLSFPDLAFRRFRGKYAWERAEHPPSQVQYPQLVAALERKERPRVRLRDLETPKRSRTAQVLLL